MNMKTCSVDKCIGQVRANGYCNKHYHKVKKYGNPLAGYEEKLPKGSGSYNALGYKRFFINGKEKLEHILIAEKALGKPLPKGAVVHHVNGNPSDNRPENLVICPNQSYHKLIHKRQDAFNATGHPDWVRCMRCGKHGSPDELYVSAVHANVAYHRPCEAEYKRNERSKNLIKA